MNFNTKLLMSLLSVLPLGAAAQSVLMDFETVQADSMGVYDVHWANSPFNTKVLEGNIAVIDNPYIDEKSDSTAKVLAFQRSRFAGNLYGAKLILKTPIAISPKEQYIHVMLNRPFPKGRVALIGLGKRNNRPGQSDETIQFVEVRNLSSVENKWTDAVFPIVGDSGITMNKIVVVPHCENTSDLANDFMVYIDNIIINDSPTSRASGMDYPVNFDINDVIKRTDRGVKGISFKGDKGSEISITLPTDKNYAYRYMPDQIAYAKPGETITPAINYQGNWMHGYVYLDYGQDGIFATKLAENGAPAAQSDLVSYSYYQGHNSTGASLSNQNPGVNSPAFTIPANTKPGIYRLRFKVDWDNADAGGNVTGGNNIVSNGGGIIDIPLNIHTDQVAVNIANRNGDVLTPDSTKISGTKVPFGQDLPIRMVPEKGFKGNGVIIRYGYLDKDSLVHSTQQYQEVTIPAYLFRNDRFVIPGKYITGDVQITAEFAELKTDEAALANYGTNFDKNTLKVTRQDRALKSIGATINSKTTILPTDSVAPTLVYQDLTQQQGSILATPGSTIAPVIRYTTGGPMHGYLYIDYNQDGLFNVAIDEQHKPTANSELVAYSYYQGYNSAGTSRGNSENGNSITIPPFVLPEMLPAGVYRARLKIDWDNTNPGGQIGERNNINDNGGRIIDFLINVNQGKQLLDIQTTNGSVYSKPGEALPLYLTPGNALDIRPTPLAAGYKLDSLIIQHGINLAGPVSIQGNTQWRIDTIDVKTLPENLAYTLSPAQTDGDVIITARFVNDDSDFTLLWSDEFNGPDGTSPDKSKWGPSTRYSSTWNRFIADSIALAHQAGGKLVLRAITNLDKSKDPANFLTGSVESSGKFSFMYGKVEARALTNPFKGNFPAIWMMPQDGSAGWPKAGEIDIFEQIDTESKAYNTLHSHWTYTLGNKVNPRSAFSTEVNMGTYNTYGVEWTPTTIDWYINGRKSGSYPRVKANEPQGQWPFDKAFYLILNQSLGDGSWASNPVTGHTYETLIDWVRVYENKLYTNIQQATNGATLTMQATPGALHLKTDKAVAVKVIDLTGKVYLNNTLTDNSTLQLPAGYYLVNNQKILVP